MNPGAGDCVVQHLTPELPGQELDHTKGSYHILLNVAGSSLAEPTPFLGDFQQYITKLLDGSSKGQFQCLICGLIIVPLAKCLVG